MSWTGRVAFIFIPCFFDISVAFARLVTFPDCSMTKGNAVNDILLQWEIFNTWNGQALVRRQAVAQHLRATTSSTGRGFQNTREVEDQEAR